MFGRRFDRHDNDHHYNDDNHYDDHHHDSAADYHHDDYDPAADHNDATANDDNDHHYNDDNLDNDHHAAAGQFVFDLVYNYDDYDNNRAAEHQYHDIDDRHPGHDRSPDHHCGGPPYSRG
jgi:zinc transport system substrate-binding protein